MRRTHGLFIVLAGLLILPSLTWSQFPGGGRGSRGFGGGGGTGPNPEGMFNFFSGGKDVIDVNEIDPKMRDGFLRLQAKMGLTGDRITREQFKEALAKQMPMFAPGGSTPPVAATPTPSGGPAPAVPAPSPSQPSREATLSERAEARFRTYDKNNDGLLSFDEMSESLQREREKWDKNKDGFIDLNEYKEYIIEREAQKAQDRQQADADRKGNDNPDQHKPVIEQPKPVVYRAGNLPKGLPEWFTRLDREGDNDGQVGLWEAKNDPAVLAEFTRMDLNGDGLITAEEILKFQAMQNGKKPTGDQTASSKSSRFGNSPGGPPAASNGFPSALPPTGIPGFAPLGATTPSDSGRPSFGRGRGGDPSDGASRFRKQKN